MSHVTKRIMVVGRPGSGKTTLVQRLSEELGVPAFHTDVYGLLPGWKPAPFNTYFDIINEIVKRDYWIIDGNSPRTLDLRIQRADIIIWLEPPLWLCMFRLFRRECRYLFRIRPGVAPGCKSHFNLSLIKSIYKFEKKTQNIINEKIEKYGAFGKKLLVKDTRFSDIKLKIL